jgi:hypothetical protein
MTKRSALCLSFGLAIATAFGCSGSTEKASSTSAGTTTGGSAGTTGGWIEPVTPPTISPASGTVNNDFKALAHSDPGATICFRTDGQKPTCDRMTAACTGGAQTYNGVSQIPINGTLTTAATGSVTVLAIACQPGEPPSDGSSESYILQVAAPTMSGPAGPATLPFEGSTPLDPQISTATLSSTSNVQMWYTVGASPTAPPTCSSGAGPLPATGTGSSGLVSDATGGIKSFLTSTTFQVIGCKTGYLPSLVSTIAYNVQLNPPTILAVNSLEDGGFWPAKQTSFDYNVTFEVDDHLNAGSSDTLCVVVGSSMPACDSSGSCDAGMPITPGGAIVGSFQIGNPRSYSELISGIACGPADLSASTVTTSGPYELLLPPVTSQPPPAGLAIPNDGGALHITLQESAANPNDPPSAQPVAYDYICWAEDNMTVPSCSMDCPQSQDGAMNGVLLGEQHGGATVQPPLAYNGALTEAYFPTGATLVGVGCLNSSPPPAVLFGPAPVVDIVISAP